MTVFVNAIMYYKVRGRPLSTSSTFLPTPPNLLWPHLRYVSQVRNPIHAVANVDDYGASARLLAATTLRNVLGTLNLGDILSQREIIAKEMQVSMCVFAVLDVFVF